MKSNFYRVRVQVQVNPFINISESLWVDSHEIVNGEVFFAVQALTVAITDH